MRQHRLLKQYSFNVFIELIYAKCSVITNSDTNLHLYLESFKKKLVRFLEKTCGLSKIVCKFVSDFLVNKPITAV